MIDAKTALTISTESLTVEKQNHLLEGIEAMIRSAAEKGHMMISMESSNFTQVERLFIRNEMRKLGFTVSEVGMNIYWE